MAANAIFTNDFADAVRIFSSSEFDDDGSRGLADAAGLLV
jgi:hypothetical protein